MKTLRPYLALYLKELKSIAVPVMILYIIIITVFLCKLTAFIITRKYHILLTFPLSNFCNIYMDRYLVNSTIFMLGVIFIFSLNIELKTGTKYQLLFLPLKPSHIILIKFLAIISMGAILSVLIVLTDYPPGQFFYRWLKGKFVIDFWTGGKRGQMNFWVYYDNYTLLLMIFDKFSRIVKYCGVICFSQGIMMTVKRRRVLVWAFSFYMSLIFINVCGVFWRSLFGIYYSIIIGTIFLIIGHILYGKYSEV